MPNPSSVSSETKPCSADRTTRVAWTALVVVEVVAAQHRQHGVQQRGGRGARLRSVEVGRVLRRRVGAGVLAGVAAVGVGDRRERVGARSSRRRRLQQRGQLPRTAGREPPAQIREPVDVDVQRR